MPCGSGNWYKALRLLDETEEQIYNQEKFISLMRLCWERKMLPVNEWVNEICSLGRERQKNFLAHASRMIGKFCPEFRFGATELYDGTGEKFLTTLCPLCT